MLPGFRFLFAAIMLSMSLLVFGLGAAALLRAAHESFASNSSWRGAPEVTFIPRNDATLPMLATLSVDTATEKVNDAAKVATAAESTPSPTESASHDQVVVSRPAETPMAETARPDSAPLDMGPAQNPPAPQAAPAIAEAATTNETKTAAVIASDASSDIGETAKPAGPQPSNAEVSTSTPTAAPISAPDASPPSKIATLGGPSVEITDVASAPEKRAARSDRAKPDQGVIKKRVQARSVVRRRQLAARARLAAQQQLQSNPFGQQQTIAPAAPRQ
jgi:hypothetical protein